MNLIGSDCCGIPIVLLCVPFFFKDGQKKKNTGADFDDYLCALKTILFCSSELRTLRYFWLFFLRPFLKFCQHGLELSWKMEASLFKGFGFSMHIYTYIYVYIIYMSASELAAAAWLPSPPTLTPSSLRSPSSSSAKWNAATTILKMLCLLNCIYIYIYFLHICAFFFLPKILRIKVAQLMIAFFFLYSTYLEILVTFKMPMGNIYCSLKGKVKGILLNGTGVQLS